MDEEGMEIFKILNDQYRKGREGRPPSEYELEICAKIQEQDKRKILTRKLLRRAKKRLKRANSNSEVGLKAAKEVDKYNHAMELVNKVLATYGVCPVLNCTKHPEIKNENTLTEVEATSCTDMDTDSEIDEQELGAAEPAEEKTDEDDFQMVSLRTAA
ncbi:hypothetical protein AVEN_152060-1 [Araneus ventricosus]|uniref:Uncharacterized protein n=1 Tax=Araneus ventricosus TaxID=182803 RepID=A0A4Y2N9P5_ARAVE|nr:hypothetical protein AVEN_152060-1 [Araneus ventricosus]